MAYLNQANLIGNVGSEPTIRDVNGGKFATFTLATTERFRDRNGDQKEQTQWHNIVAAGPHADVVEKYVHKGAQVYVGGKITYRKWTDRDGNDRFSTDIRMHTVQMLDKRVKPIPVEEEVEDLPDFMR